MATPNSMLSPSRHPEVFFNHSKFLVQIGFSIPNKHFHPGRLGLCPFARGKGTGHIEDMLARFGRVGERVDDTKQILFVCTCEEPPSDGLFIRVKENAPLAFREVFGQPRIQKEGVRHDPGVGSHLDKIEEYHFELLSTAVIDGFDVRVDWPVEEPFPSMERSKKRGMIFRGCRLLVLVEAVLWMIGHKAVLPASRFVIVVLPPYPAPPIQNTFCNCVFRKLSEMFIVLLWANNV